MRGGEGPLPRQRRSDLDIFSQLASEPDDLHARPIGTWTLKKLAMLALYFDAFTKVCKGRAYYVDGLSGPGKNRIRDAKPPFANFHVWGSPLLALRTEPRFERCILIELRPGNVQALRLRTQAFGNRARVTQGRRECRPCRSDPSGGPKPSALFLSARSSGDGTNVADCCRRSPHAGPS